MTHQEAVRGTAQKGRLTAGAVALLLVLGLSVGVFAPLGGNASSHREAPLIGADPQADATDLYAFVNPNRERRVVLIANWIPFEEPAGGPNFYAFAEKTNYDINIDNDGDAVADLTYRWKFKNHYRNGNTFLYNTGPVTSLNDENLNFYQTYNLRVIRYPSGDHTTLLRNAEVVPSHVGDASMPDYENDLREPGTKLFAGGAGRSFAGQAEDPFFLDLRVFDLLYGGDFSEIGDDTLKGFNVNTVALQVPKAELARANAPGKNPVIGVWTTTSRKRLEVRRQNGERDQEGRYVQVSRLGNPLVNEVVIPLKDKDLWNASKPSDDAQFLDYVVEPELAELIEAIYGVPAPDTCGNDNPPRCRTDLVDVFLKGVAGINRPAGVVPSEQLRLNMSIDPDCGANCSRLGVIGGDSAGFPNGRRLTDDVVDIALQVMEGELLGSQNDLGDGVNVNDVAFDNNFPFIAPPVSGSDPDPH